jgi:pilus assembly protein Flp/PilA
MWQILIAFRRNRRGATAIEYALIGALISVAIVVGAGALGAVMHDMYVSVDTKFEAAKN